MTIRGAVQGVGFRPFVYRLATELGLEGWVRNSAAGVLIEVEGGSASLEQFLLRIERERPPRAFIQSLESSFLDPVGFDRFEIRASLAGAKTALVLPDIATCPDCLREVLDPSDRRYRYPFTNCTNCGPRFSIILALPYDRPNTTMRAFEMCQACRAEYENPLDRRFHAQPTACSACGPHLELWARDGAVVATRHDGLVRAAEALRAGAVVAIKGLGGFQLVVDARNDAAVRELRRRKAREEKPFALMYPSLEVVKADCEASELEERLLRSAESPIVLLSRKRREQERGAGGAACPVASIAPGNPYLGVMLPYTPLHHLLMRELGFPVVATSGNVSDEPICTDEHEVLDRLGHLADLFLVHDRPIARHVDDSVVRVIMGRELVMRRARGYAPLPVRIRGAGAAALAVGAHLKNTIAASVGPDVFISQHIGDLETPRAFDAFRRVIGSFEALYELEPSVVACDLHPGYLSTQFARSSGREVVAVQHHFAHALACMAENEIDGPVLGVSWDGTGYGVDGTVWGGEFLRVTGEGFVREACLRPFGLPGGEAAIKEPRRAALGVLYELFGDRALEMAELPPVSAFSTRERAILARMLRQRINTPRTSSVGRLFDAVASLVGLRQEVRFEGQAAMELEFALQAVACDESYPLPLGAAPSGASDAPRRLVDWAPMIEAILDDVRSGRAVATVAARFHNALAEAVVAVARDVGEAAVVLSGGCFQNRYLTERVVRRLRAEGFRPYWHQRVPPNDGGIALGQIVAAARGR